MATPGATSDSPPAAALSVRGLDYEAGGRQILRQVDLEVAQGEVVAIMGMSGSGKTSLLKCMAGLRKPTGGSILLHGQDIAPMSEHKLDQVRLQIGLVFQYAALFDSMSVFDNVAFGLVQHRRLPRAQVAEVVAARLADVDMEEAENLLPAQLSGGMQKRVGLARALAMEPSILLYDEPTSGLDPVIARTIDELILRTRDRLGMTSVVVSHDIASIFRIADRVAMLHDGSVIASGTPDEMRASTHPTVRAFVADE